MKLIDRSKVLSHCALPILVVVMCMPTLAQMTSVGIDCAQIYDLGIDKQDNMRAGLAMIECGLAPAGHPQDPGTKRPPAPPNVLVSNRACVSASSCTKSENMVWANPAGTTIVVNYNDHNA